MMTQTVTLGIVVLRTEEESDEDVNLFNDNVDEEHVEEEFEDRNGPQFRLEEDSSDEEMTTPQFLDEEDSGKPSYP